MNTNYMVSLKLFFFVFVATLIGCPSPNAIDHLPHDKTYTWTVDTLIYDLPFPPPSQVNVQCIWGSSAHDVWAVAVNDVIFGELWHYNGKAWHSAKNWPYNGIDEGGSYLNDLFAVTGFDSTNVYFFGFHSYDTTGTNIVLKWNGQSWSVLPWQGGSAPRGGLGWGVKQAGGKLWAVSSAGQVVKYEGGFLGVDTVIPGFRLINSVIAALDNGEVYVNAFKDSLQGDTLLRGTLTKLYRRGATGNWSILEDKFIAGAYYDGNGLGLGLYSVGGRLFTGNLGLWELKGQSWVKQLGINAIGGESLYSEEDMWVYYKQELWHYNEGQWLQIRVPQLTQYPGFALYGRGWSNASEVFISFHDGNKSYVLHGIKTGG